jgi:thiamine-phosphate pyrophosphorylase
MQCQVESAAQGIHYTEKSRPRPPLPPKDNLTISSAFHDLQQLDVKYGALDYAFLSPIFDSISKAGYQAAFDLNDLTTCIAACNIPLVALGGKGGSLHTPHTVHLKSCSTRSLEVPCRLKVSYLAFAGITAANIPQVKRLGFSGAAVLGSVWSSSNPVVACTELLTACASP